MDLSIIIVNWNTKRLTAQVLLSIYKYTKGVSFEIILIDNASSDGSQKYLQKKFPLIKFIFNKKNLGFGNANNQGVKVAKGEYILFLNSDTYLLENSLKKLIMKANKTKNVGAIGPLLLNEDKSVQQSVGFFPHLPQVFFWSLFLDDLPGGILLKPYHVDHDSFYKYDHQVDWLTGAALLIPKKVLDKIGAFDEKIFMYGEDVDLCKRIKDASLKVIFTPVTKIVHIRGGSTDKISTIAFIGEYKGLKYLYKKYKGNLALQILSLLLKIGALARILIFGALGRTQLSKAYVEVFKMA